MTASARHARAGRGPANQHSIPFAEAVRVWLRIAALSFGGPAGQIAVMHRILVEEKRWIGENRFLHALNYCMLLPGPEAQQLAVYIGWLLHSTKGGLVAGSLFILPGFVSILALSYVYAAFGDVGLIAGLFFGLKAAVLAIVLHAVRRIGARALQNWAMVSIAAAAFVAIFFFHVPFPAIILAAALVGYAGRPCRIAAVPARRRPCERQDEGLLGCRIRPRRGHSRPCPPESRLVAARLRRLPRALAGAGCAALRPARPRHRVQPDRRASSARWRW